ncbi:MAG TPA: lipopolysaccharide assembly protein LapB [Gammaproteobacteria bacterium]|nr:lipopolysaccharide assembly protein LapB [Gammaproteobacteria bacterium]
MIELFWLLLPVAALSGWWVARFGDRGRSRKRASALSADYYRGLNFLLNEEQDKALEVFMRLVEVDSETIETHLALGGLFRRRGEVDRAIRIHQNLLARPSLDQLQRSVALLELAKDYMHAGLLDRAETLFRDLVRQRSQLKESLEHLLELYQRENEWQAAIDVARELGAMSGESLKPVIAHCYCEIGLQHKKNNVIDKAIAALKSATAEDPRSVRPNILLGNIFFEDGQYQAAYRHYLRIFEQDEEFIPEILDRVIECVEKGIPAPEFESYVRILSKDQKRSMLIPGLARYIFITQGFEPAIGYINEQLKRSPTLRSLKEWVVLEKLGQREQHAQLFIVIEALRKVLQQLPSYQCRQCGYASTMLSWQCPGCHHWSSIKPGTRFLSH